MVPIPEGQAIVHCPFCEQRSFVRGERGLRRYQVAQRVDQEKANAGLREFLTGHRAIARDVAKKAKLTEIFVAYLPFWVVWAKVLGWVFGEKKVGSGDDARYEPREIKIAQEMDWNGAACDVGEFGVELAAADRPTDGTLYSRRIARPWHGLRADWVTIGCPVRRR